MEITPKNVRRAIGLGPRLKKRGGSEGSDVTLPCIQLTGISKNCVVGRIAWLRGARNPHVPGRTLRLLRAPRLTLHPPNVILETPLHGVVNPLPTLIIRRRGQREVT